VLLEGLLGTNLCNFHGKRISFFYPKFFGKLRLGHLEIFVASFNSQSLFCVPLMMHLDRIVARSVTQIRVDISREPSMHAIGLRCIIVFCR